MSAFTLCRIEALRAQVRALESTNQRMGGKSLPFGLETIDRRLAGGGLSLAALHEISGEEPALSDDAAATLFAAGIAARRQGTVLWAMLRRDLFAPALAQAGLSPHRLIYAECGSEEEVLAVMEDGLRHGSLALVIGEVSRATMAPSRRLQLAAEESGTTALMLRRWHKENPLRFPSAAMTRWRIGCAPSGSLPVSGVGRPRWRVNLARQRGGEPHLWILEGTDAEGRLALPALSAHRPIAAGGLAAIAKAA